MSEEERLRTAIEDYILARRNINPSQLALTSESELVRLMTAHTKALSVLADIADEHGRIEDRRK